MVWSFESATNLDAKKMRTEFMTLLHTDADQNSSDFDAAELIYAELIGNCMRHAPGRITIGLEWELDDLRLTVHDTVKTFRPNFALPECDMQETGRGLFIVKALAKSVYVRDIEGVGSEIVAILPVTRRVAC